MQAGFKDRVQIERDQNSTTPQALILIKTKQKVRASRLLLLMHIIDARIYADLEFEIHPSIPLINCPNNDCN